MSLIDDFLRDLANGPRIAREITERAARECGVCHHCGRDLAEGPCRMTGCPVRAQAKAVEPEQMP